MDIRVTPIEIFFLRIEPKPRKKKGSLALKISSVNVTKSGNIFNGKLHILCSEPLFASKLAKTN